MKLTPENRAMLEKADALLRRGVNTAQDPSINAELTRQFFEEYGKSPYDVVDEAVPLLLEIWEPLQEMVEARGKCDFKNMVINYYDHGGARLYTENNGSRDLKFDCYGSEENREFLTTTINALAAIRKAVG